MERLLLATVVVGGKTGRSSRAGRVAVRTRVVPGRSQCTTSRVRRADWWGGWESGLCTQKVRCEDALVDVVGRVVDSG
jgi:hypothetical protein